MTLRLPWAVQRVPTPSRLLRNSLSSQAQRPSEEEEGEEVEGQGNVPEPGRSLRP